MIRVTLCKNPFEPLTFECALYGRPKTIAELFARHPMPEHFPVTCQVNGVYVLRSDDWDTYMPPEGATIQFRAHAVTAGGGGGGKKNPLATILMLVVVAAVTYGAGALLAPAAAGAAAGTGSILGTVGITGTAAQVLVGVGSSLLLAGASYLINLALPPSFPKPPSTPDPAYDIISRSNQARLGAPQEVRFGRTEAYPSLCAAPFSEFSDSFVDGTLDDGDVGDSTLFEIYNVGWGYYDIESYKLVNQELGIFPEIVVNKFEPGERVNSFPSSIVSVAAVNNVELKFALGGSQRGGIAQVSTLFDGGEDTNEVQRLTIEKYEVGGTLTLSFLGQETEPLAYPASAEEVQAALVALAAIGTNASGSDNVLCTGGPLGSLPIDIEFVNDLSFRPVSSLVVDADDLTESAAVFGNWGTVTHGGFDQITAVGVEDNMAYLEVDGTPFGVEDSLIGSVLVFLDREVDKFSPESYQHARASAMTTAASIASNTANRIYWEIPDGPSTLKREATGEVKLPRLKYPLDPDTVVMGSFKNLDRKSINGLSFFEVAELRNWQGPFKINPDDSSDVINQIGVDIALPQGRYFNNDNGNPIDIGLGWRIEYQELDASGVGQGPWKPLVSDSRYIRIPKVGGHTFFAAYTPPANVHLGGFSTSPTRFSVTGDVPDGRYQVRIANCFRTNMLYNATTTDIEAWAIPGGYLPSVDNAIGNGYNFSDLENGSGVFGKSYWSGLRGYGTRRSLSWEDRTIITVRAVATESVNANTLSQFAVLATRKLQDYVGPRDESGIVTDGVLPLDALTTFVLAGVGTVEPSTSQATPFSLRTSQIVGPGIGNMFEVGHYVRLSGFVDDGPDLHSQNNGEWPVLSKTLNAVTVRGSLTSTPENVAQVAGSRKIVAQAPTIISGVEVTGAHTIAGTGIGLLPAFSTIGNRVTLSGFADPANRVKTTIVGVADDELTVEATLVIEGPSADTKAHSVPPYGLVGEILDHAVAVLSDADTVGGIDPLAINTVEFDNVSVVVTEDGRDRITTLEATGLGTAAETHFVTNLGRESLLGERVYLGGFSEKANQDSAIITAYDADSLTVALAPQTSNDPEPTRSSFVSETGAAGKKVLFGARPIFRSGDTEIYFYADQGATSAATGGGTVVYAFPNEWTGLVPSRRISSAAYDAATDNNYGGGADASRVNLEELAARERTWDARDRYKANGIDWKTAPIKDRYDAVWSERKLIHDYFTEMFRAGRARPLYPAGKLTAIRDEPRAVADGMYGSRNIVTGSLSYANTYPTEDTADYVLAQFFNEDFWDFDEVVATDIPYSLAQELTLRAATSGEFYLTYNDERTAAIAYNASAATVQAALEALGTTVVTAGSLVCTGGPLGTATITITYAEDLLGTNVPLLEVDQWTLLGGRARIVYDINPAWPGTAPARLVMPGVVQRQQAWREAMYELYSAKYRRLLVTFKTDVEGYIPSFLSRVILNDESIGRGQSGIIVGAEPPEAPTSIFCSENLNWGEGTHVIQLRDKMGQPVPEGLAEVIPGTYMNEAVLADGAAFDPELLGIWTDHQSTREATFFSFGPVNNHAIDLLVTGIRPMSREEVGIEGYYYDIRPYAIDGDLEYMPPDEQDILDARMIGRTIEGLSAIYHVGRPSPRGNQGEPYIVATWKPAPWARRYLVEVSDVEDGPWRKVESTTTTYSKTSDINPAYVETKVAEGFTCGAVLSNIVTIIVRNAGTEPTPFTAGQYDGLWLVFTSGSYAGQRFKIAQTYAQAIYLSEVLDPEPVAATDTYDIVEQSYPYMYLRVRGFNGVYGPPTTVAVPVGGIPEGGGVSMPFTGLPPRGTQVVTIPPNLDTGDPGEAIVTETWRFDWYGNLIMSGRLVDGDHVLRSLHIGTQPRYDGEDLSVAWLPEEPRITDGVTALLLFLDDSCIQLVTSSPGESEFTLTGKKIQLGFARDPSSHLHFIMVGKSDYSDTLAGIRVGEPCSFTPSTSTATLPFTPARPEEVLLFLNGDYLAPVASGPVAGQYSLSGTTITIGSYVLEATDVLLALGLADDGTTEAYRFHCSPFEGNMIPWLPLFTAQTAIAQGGTMRWNEPGFGNFTFREDVEPPVTMVRWSDPAPVEGSVRYAILIRAKVT